MSDLIDIRSLIVVLETGGFSRAAAQLGVSKSIISRRIARLEEDLGTRLLSRTTRGISATDAGLEFKARGERILADLQEARDAVQQRGDGLSGRLRLSAPLSFGVRYMAPLLAELAQRHPRLEIDAAYSDRITDIVGDGFDVALRIGRLKDSSLVARRIAPVYTAVVASPAYLEAHGTPQQPDDINRHECLIYSGATVAEWRFKAGRKWVSVHPQGRLRADSGEAILRWATDGLGLAALPTFLCSDAIHSGSLVPVLTDYPLPEAALHAVRPPGVHVPRKVRMLIDAAVDRFAEDHTWDPCRLAVCRANAATGNAEKEAAE
ncbi:LysR family transcriptional regulator [Breoghania sp. L-A4]|uniref:LysR family transcriptional regulator n=1 Tax=Breoghania sp. L-A4 TaxID=2304600 RepID=UPI000E35A180|nr:LysR family transcriptional regulator [Breoghania sp. L-A4]AXS39727.1 LysR family transcriptional regulator [Breoghania sp. L-A4]